MAARTRRIRAKSDPICISVCAISCEDFRAYQDSLNSARHEGWSVRSHQPTILAAFANAPMYGGGMKIAPCAQMDDGLLDVCVVGGVDPFKLFCMFPSVYFGRHLGICEVEYFSAPRLRVET